jgi:hypothetical protein
MKTQTELEREFAQMCDHLHLQDDDDQRFRLGLMTALLWVMDRYPTWVDCEIAAEELWQYSRVMRANLLACLPR